MSEAGEFTEFTAWYNYRKGKYDHLTSTPEDFSDYVSQGAGVGLYRLLVKTGKDPQDAALEVLQRQAGIHND